MSQLAFENPIGTQYPKVMIMSVLSDKSISRGKYSQNRKVMIMRDVPAYETFYTKLIYKSILYLFAFQKIRDFFK